MARPIDSGALRWIGRALGISAQSPQHIDLLDNTVHQSLDIGQLVRRGRADISNAGLGIGVMRNIHTDAESLASTIDPYNVGAAAIKWPTPVRDDFDIWLLAAAVHQTSGGGTISAALAINYGLNMDVWGIDDNDVPVTGFGDVITVAWWNSLLAGGGGDVFGALGGDGLPFQRIGWRLPRSTPPTILQFTSTSSITTTFDCQLLLGLFPVALGQDGIA